MPKAKDQESHHEPVLVREIVKAFNLDNTARSKKRARIIDATLGLGGHSIKFCQAGAQVLGIEIDASSLKIAERRLRKACPSPSESEDISRGSFKLIQGNFKDIKKIVKGLDFTNADGVLFDLGVSSKQLISPERGFSFSNPDADLDMRLDTSSQAVKASDLLNSLPKEHLVTLFSRVLNKGDARKLAKQIVTQRSVLSFGTVSDFLKAIKRSGLEKYQSKLHFATKPFLALRMAVNSELENLKRALPKSLDVLKKKGKVAVISFHSGEDAVVKEFGKKMHGLGKIKVINKKPIRPKKDEIEMNPRSRSAKLRIFEKK